MKMVLLILVALLLSAQPAHDPAFIPGEYLTAGALNGHWWTHATPLERRIYLLAYRDGSQGWSQSTLTYIVISALA